MIVLGLDPGTEQSALVACDQRGPLWGVTQPNAEVLQTLTTLRVADPSPWTLVIEACESFGMAVGIEVFRTVFWAGRFAQAWEPRAWVELPRRTVKQHLCHTARATDSNIRQALIDRFGPGKAQAIGTKRAPGPLYGLKAHTWSAFALAVTWADRAADTSGSQSERGAS